MPQLPTLDESQPTQTPDEDASETVDFASSLVIEGTYTPAERTLDLTFVRGGEATYTDVPPEVWTNMKMAPSVGRYYLANVKDRYSWS